MTNTHACGGSFIEGEQLTTTKYQVLQVLLHASENEENELDAGMGLKSRIGGNGCEPQVGRGAFRLKGEAGYPSGRDEGC